MGMFESVLSFGRMRPFGRMRCAGIFLLAFGYAASVFALVPVVDRTDFVTGENTNGWFLSEGTLLSPRYPVPVTNVALEALLPIEGAVTLSNRADHAVAIHLPAAARVTAFTAFYTLPQLSAPVNLAATNILEGAFDLAWDPVADATGYRLAFYSNRVEGASAGSILWEETFAGLPSKGNATALSSEDLDAGGADHEGWLAEGCFYPVSPVSNVVQMGSTSYPGHLMRVAPEDCGLEETTLAFTAWRFNNEAGEDMPVLHIAGSSHTTNVLGVVALSTDPAEHFLALPRLSAGDLLCFHSVTNKVNCRTLLGNVRILSGYDPGLETPCLFATAETEGAVFSTNAFPLFSGSVTVQALAERAEDDSAPSAPLALDLIHPPSMPILRAYPLSQAVEGVYAADFQGLDAVVRNGTPWYNGVSPVPYWMGYNNRDECVATIGVGTTNTSTSGFFAFRSDWYPEKGAVLGWRGTSERDFHLGLVLVNDTLYPLHKFTVSLAACQWNWRNEAAMTNAFEYLVTNALVGTSAPGNWKAVPALDIVPPHTRDDHPESAPEWWDESRVQAPVALEGLTLHAGEYLVLRFTDRRTKSSGGVGVNRFKVVSERKPLTSCLFLR